MEQRAYDLIAYIKDGKFLEAFEKFYAENVDMAENQQPSTVGKAANREREAAWWATVQEVHAYDAASVLIDGPKVTINWQVDYTDTNNQRLSWSQYAIQEWGNGLIVSERFVYDPNSVEVAA